MSYSMSWSRLSKFVIALGFSVLVVGCSSQPALVTASIEGNNSQVDALLAAGYDPNVLSEGGATPLYSAARANHIEVMKSLLAAGAKVDKGYGLWSPLNGALRTDATLDVVKILIDAGADLNTRNADGWTPLAMAARYRSAAHVELLLDAGADIEATNKHGMTPLYLALAGEDPAVATLLVERGASLSATTNEGKTILAYAAEKNGIKPEALKALRTKYEINERKATLISRLEAVEEKDAELPLSLKRDKYLVAFTSALKSENYIEAVLYANLLDRLGEAMEDSFYYFWGEALLAVGSPDAAIEKLNFYLTRVGSSGKYYTQALQMILNAEKARDGAVI
ncbi:ankyrin repeat domain-containing protein [Spongiibacter taiwanensis]|uniref:ankyrin repeat domain-containing protein n=1 Tax=Spongiibacter taiwanensis TaxID=1748242 RepID=UPI002035F9CC|nr:ankyrin repeat domain-containing protein [Spongiibacter taiwanensis]USA43041.1 ankyrin repeat domain-containing protein [Spongiibacter taiwanensis]